MSRLPPIVSMLVVVWVWLAAPVVRADLAAEARFHDELAREHYAARRYDRALREFFTEQRLAPNPRILFNIALCFEQLRREGEAFLFFTEYLASEDQDTERRSYAASAVARIEPRLALVEVTSDPPGAAIYVDQREHGEYGRTPRLLPLTPGTRTIHLELEGHRTVSVDVVARIGARASAQASLVRVVGQLSVIGPEGAQLTVRDATGAVAHEGRLPSQADLAPGDYVLEVNAEGHEPWRGLVRVEADRTVQLEARPSPLPPPTGALTVTSGTSGAVVELDGEAVGFTPVVLPDLTLGRHRVRVRHPGLQPWAGDVETVADERAWLTVTLEPEAQVQRSPLTWGVGILGAALAVGGIVTGGVALDVRSQYDALRMQSDSAVAAELVALRERGSALNVATDVLLLSGVVALAAAVVLYFATEYVEHRRSRGSVTRGER